MNERYPLTSEQKTAIRLLADGNTSIEAAQLVGVDPETLRQWRNEDIAFMAGYNDEVSDQHRAATRRLAEGKARAIERLADFVDDGDPNVALRAASVLARISVPEPTGETNPDKLDASMSPFGGFGW